LILREVLEPVDPHWPYLACLASCSGSLVLYTPLAGRMLRAARE
jgi:hypothetical protein